MAKSTIYLWEAAFKETWGEVAYQKKRSVPYVCNRTEKIQPLAFCCKFVERISIVHGNTNLSSRMNLCKV